MAAEQGLCLMAAGHHATEHPAMPQLAKQLRAALPGLPVEVFDSDPARWGGIGTKSCRNVQGNGIGPQATPASPGYAPSAHRPPAGRPGLRPGPCPLQGLSQTGAWIFNQL